MEQTGRGNHGTDNVLRYAMLLREIVTQFDSGKNERLIWELSLSPRDWWVYESRYIRSAIWV